MTRKYWVFSLAVITAICISVFFFIPEKKVEQIKIGVLPHIIPTLPHWIAVKEKFYEDEGLDIKIYPQRSSSVLIQSMINGDIDYIPGVATVDVINAFADSKMPLKAKIISHARIMKNTPFTGLIVTKNSAIATLKDIEGKKIAVFPGNTAKAALKVFLKNKGIDLANISMIPVLPPEHLGVLQSGDVDVSFAYEPLRTLLLQKYSAAEIYSAIYANLNEPAAIGVTIISNKLIQQNKSALNKLISVWNRSIDFISSNENRAREILKDKLKLDPSIAKNAAWVNATKTNEIDFKVLENEVISYQKMGIINATFTLDHGMVFVQ